MREVILSPSATGILETAVREEIQRVLGQKGRIYRTTYREPSPKGHTVHFLTTSKELCLFLSQMSEEGQVDLATLVMDNVGPRLTGSCKLFFEGEGKPWIVVTTLTFEEDKDDRVYTIHLDPAN